MNITDVRVRKIEKEGKMKAVVSITIDQEFVIHDIKVLNNAGTIFLAMPSRTTKAGTFKDIVHPINQDVRKAFERLIIGAYERAVKKNHRPRWRKLHRGFYFPPGEGILRCAPYLPPRGRC